MKSLLKLVPLIIILILTIIYQNSIINYIVEKAIFSKEIYIAEPNDYAINYNFQFVQITDDFIADNKKELLNIIYTFLNNGDDNFYFFCHYDNCKTDLNDLIINKKLTDINNYVHPYNSYRQIYFSINSFDKIEAVVQKSYTDDNINDINKKIDKIMTEIITKNMTDREKIIAFHDYIIETTVYDSEYIDLELKDINNPSHRAIGPLFLGKALCGGYTDAMSIFLNKLDIPNYRISNKEHVWNYVYLDNKWYHLDVTWDDPITDNGSNVKLDTFLLITTKQLENLKTGNHNYDKNIYSEAK